MITYPNGQSRDYTYDDQGRLTQIANVHPTTGHLATYAYGYDVDNTTGLQTMLSQRSSVTATVPSQGFSAHNTLYFYDNNYQLKQTNYPNVAPFNSESHEWTYDAIGNRLTNKINSTTQNYTYYKNGANPLNGQKLQSDGTKTYTYDNNGSLIGDGTYTNTWNIENRITGIGGGGLTASYKYDYMGRRISKTINSVITEYAYDGQNLLAERGATPVDYLYGLGIDEPLAVKSGANIYYFSVDGLGSASLVSDTNGAVQNKYLYDAWGIVRSQTTAVTNSFGYTSREFSEAGLMYYRARYYNPNIGRFVSEDSLGFKGGPNFYAYVLNDPIKLLDPSGHVTIHNNLRERVVPPQSIPFNCPQNSKACTRVTYAFVLCDCEGDSCPPPLPIFPKVTFVFGGPMYLPVGGTDWGRKHEYGCHIDPAIAAVLPMLQELESTPFWSKESCQATCDATSQGVKNKFYQTLKWTQDNEANCQFRVR